MKIIIEKDGIKREILGPFNICGSANDLATIVRCIDSENIITYGWVKISEREPFTPNTPPRAWSE